MEPLGKEKEYLGTSPRSGIQNTTYVFTAADFQPHRTLAFFWLTLRTLTIWGFYRNYNEETKRLTFWRGSEVCQGTVPVHIEMSFRDFPPATQLLGKCLSQHPAGFM